MTYLREYEADVSIREGGVIHLRPVRTEDAPQLVGLFAHSSPHSIFLRFHQALPRLSQDMARQFATVDYQDSFALVATVDEGGQEHIVGLGHYIRLPGQESAEAAFWVEDAYQRKGIGTALLRHLAAVAREKGVKAFEANVLPQNTLMLQVLRNSGLSLEIRLQEGVYHAVIPTAPPAPS